MPWASGDSWPHSNRGRTPGPCPRHYDMTGMPIRCLSHLDAPIAAERRARADVRRAIGVAVDAHATAGAAESPPPWRARVDMPARRACPRRVVFGKVVARAAEPLNLVAHIGFKLSARPLRQLLVGFAALVRPVSNVAHVANRQPPHAPRSREVGQAAACGVEDVALLAIELGRGLMLALCQPFPATAALATAGEFGRQRAVAFVAQPLERAQVAPVQHKRIARSVTTAAI